jgi:hypothetical protein
VKYGVLLGTAWRPLFCGGLFHHIVNIGPTPRQWQSRAALALLNKHNVMLISATDSEKSLAFQSLSLLKEGSQQLGESLQEIRAGKTAVPVKTNRKQEWFVEAVLDFAARIQPPSLPATTLTSASLPSPPRRR